MKFKDYYETLGVPRGATQDEVKRAYRKLARKFHPDVSKDPDAESRFKELGEAYAVLKDPEKRAAYDVVGSQWQPGQDFQPPPDWDAGFEFSGGDAGAGTEFSDFFESLFGRQAQGRHRADGQMHGQDHHAKVLIDLANPLSYASGELSLTVCNTDSLGEQIQRAHQHLKVVKALNTMNADVMVHPEIVPGEHEVFICGNDSGAKETVTLILTGWFGWKTVLDLGDISAARGLEMVLPLWISLSGRLGTYHFNFHLAK